MGIRNPQPRIQPVHDRQGRPSAQSSTRPPRNRQHQSHTRFRGSGLSWRADENRWSARQETPIPGMRMCETAGASTASRRARRAAANVANGSRLAIRSRSLRPCTLADKLEHEAPAARPILDQSLILAQPLPASLHLGSGLQPQRRGAVRGRRGTVAPAGPHRPSRIPSRLAFSVFAALPAWSHGRPGTIRARGAGSGARRGRDLHTSAASCTTAR